MTDDQRTSAEALLGVYASRDGGWCNPHHGDIAIPDGGGSYCRPATPT